MGCTLCPSSMYTITFERLLHVNKVRVVIQSIKLREKGREILLGVFFFFCFHIFLTTPLLFTSRSRPRNPIKRLPNRCSSH